MCHLIKFFIPLFLCCVVKAQHTTPRQQPSMRPRDSAMTPPGIGGIPLPDTRTPHIAYPSLSLSTTVGGRGQDRGGQGEPDAVVVTPNNEATAGPGDGVDNEGRDMRENSSTPGLSELATRMEETQKTNKTTKEELKRLAQLVEVLQTTPINTSSCQAAIHMPEEATPVMVESCRQTTGSHDLVEGGPIGDLITPVALVASQDYGDSGVVFEEVCQPCDTAQVHDGEVVIVGEIVAGKSAPRELGIVNDTTTVISEDIHSGPVGSTSLAMRDEPSGETIPERGGGSPGEPPPPAQDSPGSDGNEPEEVTPHEAPNRKPKFRLAASFEL